MAAGVWKRTLQYLGLVEDEEYEELGEVVERPVVSGAQDAVRVPEPPPAVRTVPPPPAIGADNGDSIVRTIPRARARTAAGVHRATPGRFNEARDLAERFKSGTPVVMNLRETDDSTARRLVDFASGLVFARDGRIEMLAPRVYLLSPDEVELPAEERERLREDAI